VRPLRARAAATRSSAPHAGACIGWRTARPIGRKRRPGQPADGGGINSAGRGRDRESHLSPYGSRRTQRARGIGAGEVMARAMSDRKYLASNRFYYSYGGDGGSPYLFRQREVFQWLSRCSSLSAEGFVPSFWPNGQKKFALSTRPVSIRISRINSHSENLRDTPGFVSYCRFSSTRRPVARKLNGGCRSILSKLFHASCTGKFLIRQMRLHRSQAT